MELPSLGMNCSVIGCNRLDFLPLRCECGKMFCNDHFMEHTEVCEAFRRSKAQSEVDKITYACNFDGCSDISLFNFPCKKCGLHYCISHRHHKACDISEEELEQERKKWNLPLEQYNKAKEKLDMQLNKTAMKMAPDSKKSKLSNKIQLMRLKGKAIGAKDVPTQDRLYFLIYKPLDMNPKLVMEKTSDPTCGSSQTTDQKQKAEAVPVYVSKNWSVGKIIDSISQFCKVMNNNNKINESKLRLFRATDGLIVSPVMSMKISSILEENTVKDGESLILEYVEGETCTTSQCYLQQYTTYAE